MRWPWSKTTVKLVAQATDAPKEEPKGGPKWTQRYGEWRLGLFCHCGKEVPSMNGLWIKPEVCPACGCDWAGEKIKGRDEWEEQPTIYGEFYSYRPKRNEKFVRWVECTTS